MIRRHRGIRQKSTPAARASAVVALGENLGAAATPPAGVRAISWAGARYRTDIALKAKSGEPHQIPPRATKT